MATELESVNADITALREREAAVREILQVIGASRSNPAPVFDTILKNAAHLSNAPLANLCLLDETRSHWTLVAHHGDGLRHLTVGQTTRLSDSNLVPAQTIRSGTAVHVEDLVDTDLYRQGDPGRIAMVEEEGMRTILGVPLLRDREAIGCITLFRRNVKPFTEDDVEILETFAVQAVIAIENVRQFRQVQERLEREQATAQILDVISRSRDDEQPVLDAIVSNAAVLMDAHMAGISLLNAAATHLSYTAVSGPYTEYFPEGTEFDLAGPLQVAVTVREARTIHTPDLADDPLYAAGDPVRRKIVDDVGVRTFLTVPLIMDGAAFGCLNLNRKDVRPFALDEIKLIESFAAQAVIAIENVRQFREVKTRLEREAASKEILSVINRSRDDETPVFRAILDRAERLCNAQGSGLQLVNDARTHLLMMDSKGDDHGSFPVGFKFDLSEPLAMCIAVNEAKVVQIEDLKDTDLYREGHPGRVALVDVEGVRTHLHVPLLKNGVAFGNITLSRKEVIPFSNDEIALVETFAEQAVIAIENVGQFREVQERLEREAATSEVLNVISQSRSDAQPVFRTILENAARLCGAPHAMLLLRDAADAHLVLAANNAAQSVFIDQIKDKPHRLDNTNSYAVRAVLEQRVIHVPDLREATEASKSVPQIKVALELEGMRTVLQVPLLQGDRAIGVIALYTLEVAPFTDDQIKLVETFAAQAVIAIENTKQLQNLEALNAELGDRVEEQVGEIERMGKLKRFLPAAVADTVVMSGSEDMLKSHRALLGVLFCDIRGFTAFCETAEPEETIEVLQTYHEEMGKLINAHGAGVDHRMGDGIMVLFNDPITCDDPAGDAVRLAIAMRARMAELGKDWKRMGFRLGFGVGVSLGYATVGMVGYEGRSDYTASGTAINVASRLCEMAEDGEVLLSTRAAVAVEDDFASVSTGEVTLKGIREPVEVFRLTEVSEA